MAGKRETNSEKKDLRPSVVLAVITAIITAALTVGVNQIAFDHTKEQAQYEHKVKAVETFSKVAMNMIILLRSMDEIRFQESKMLIDSVKEKHTDDPFKDIDSSKTINSKTNAAVDKIMSKADTAVYHQYKVASAYMSDYFSAYYSSINFFGKPTRDEFEELNSLMQPDSFRMEVRQLMASDKIKLLKDIDWSKIDGALLPKRTLLLKNVLQSMSDLN